MADAFFPLETLGLSVTLGGHAALTDVSLAIDGKRRIVVLGANGAGQSVPLRTLDGPIDPPARVIPWGRRLLSRRLLPAIS